MSDAPVPRWFEPMKAVLTDEPFSDAGWIFERKLDGVRCLTIRDGGELRLLSRERFAADGEIVAFERGVTSFSRLQGRMGLSDPEAARRSGIGVFLYLFDLVHVDGEDIADAPLRTRKARLRQALSFRGPVRYTPHRNEHGEQMYAEACRRGPTPSAPPSTGAR